MDVYLLLAELAYDQRRDLDLAFSWLDKIPATSKAAVRGELLRAGDLLLLLGEAELRLGRDSAPTTLRTAVDIMEKHYASGSRSLAWGRQLLAGKMVEQ